MEPTNTVLTVALALMFVLAIVAKRMADWADKQNGLA
jgi:hypothetical protein